jgi:hypothetical protein
MLAVEAIKFSQDPTAATNDALNLRRDAAGFSSLPEWRRFICVNPEDSRAAYAIAPTQGNVITVMASLRSTDASIALAEVRVEHHLKLRAVTFVNGASGFVAFELIDPPSARGHGRDLGRGLTLGVSARASSSLAALRSDAA